MNSTAFWDLMTCSLVAACHLCRGITYLRFQGASGLKEEETDPSVHWYLSTRIHSFTLQKRVVVILSPYTVTYRKSPIPDHHVTTVQTLGGNDAVDV